MVKSKTLVCGILVLFLVFAISVVVVPSPQPLSYAQNQTGAANVVSDDGVRKLVAADNISTTSINPSTSLIQQSSVGMNSNASGYILHRGIISSERGQPEQLKVQRTIILQHRQDGKDYTGTLTFTATGHRLIIDNKTLSNIDTKKFGDLFLVNPIHPNAGYVLSAPTIIKPDYKGSSPPYLSASIPFVASSVVLRTLGGIPFIAVYEVSAHVGQPQFINNITRSMNSNSTAASEK
jgi:hypothetical protein